MPLVDTHCHLDFPDFSADREQIVASCLKLGIEKIIMPGVYHFDWNRLIDFHLRFPSLYAAFGIHPCYLEGLDQPILDSLESAVQAYSQLVAIGETGLDFYLTRDNEAWQRQFFEGQIEIAARFKLPLILHVRKAHDQVIGLLKSKKFIWGGVVHCYSGSLQQANRYLDLGFKLGIGGVVTYSRAKRLRQIVHDLPLESFVLETDAPDIPVFGKAKQRNRPENLIEIFQAFSSLRPEPVSELETHLYRNSLQLFPRMAT